MRACPACGTGVGGAARFCPECGADLAVATLNREQRKTVTVLFCDLSGSTALGETLDPERLRTLLARYYDRMRGIVERHGGTVEKFIGDAVMAVFGVPVLHEDDALRAVRAAIEMRGALPELGLLGRIGLTTGEVVTGAEEWLATGDAVNVAARLEQMAQPGEVLIGKPTLDLVNRSADVEAVEPLRLKGKAEPVLAYRLLQVRDAPQRRHGMPFVGRDRELAILRQSWERVHAQKRCEMVTVIGDAGVGKSRLVSELEALVDATVVRGRCLPYGDGITYWPVVEVLKQLGVRPTDQTAASALGSILGESKAVTSAEDIAWAFRKTLEQVAAKRPLMIVFDDIQWGEETFLELIDHVALLSSGGAILLLCLARPELAELRPAWPVTLRLGPLGESDVKELLPHGFPDKLRDRVAHAAGGNPLFIEEMVAILLETNGDLAVPPSLQALLAARLDRLEPAERSVLERGSIEGEIFHRGAVQALAHDNGHVTARLAALVRKELIRPDRPHLAGEDAFRFRHILIRDAAYAGLAKSARADLHARYASWLQDHGAELSELDEIVGYHLGQAVEYRAELGMPGDEDLVASARQRLTFAAHRAAQRQDAGAAASLYERAVELVPPTEFDLALESELSDALLWAGRGGDALRRADALAERAAAAGDRVSQLSAKIMAGMLRLTMERGGERERFVAVLDEALPVLEAAGNDVALYIGYYAASERESERGRMESGLAAWEIALQHAHRAGIQPTGSLAGRAAYRFFGTTPVDDVLAWIEENEPQVGRDHFLRAYRAGSLAMIGQFDQARAILSEDRAAQAERGGGILLANLTAFESVWVELWAGTADAAVEFAREGWRLHEELGTSSFLAHAAGSLARSLYAVDQIDDAGAWATRAAELASDPWTDMLSRQVRAKVYARRGEHAHAGRLAREAVGIGEETEMLDRQADSYLDLAEVLLLADTTDEARLALREAVERYDRKGNSVMAGRARNRLVELERAPNR